MTYSWNRRFPVQPFSSGNLAGAGVIPGPGRTFTFSTTATVVFVATAAVSSTRTASVTASVSFIATNIGIEIEPDTVATISGEPDIGGNMFNQNQSMPSSGSW